jgi:hypothetical protein
MRKKKEKYSDSRNAAKILLADNFFPDDDAEKLFHIGHSLQFVQKEYGEEVDNFNLTKPNIDQVFSQILREDIMVDEDRSGVFRKPMCGIHFEAFDSIDEWCFVVSLDKTETLFNYYSHESGVQYAYQDYRFNYRNFFEWKLEGSIVLKQNQCIIFRPWIFHSIENGLIQYYRLLKKK